MEPTLNPAAPSPSLSPDASANPPASQPPLAPQPSPPKVVPTPDTRAIFVGNFEYDSKTADLERLFSHHGPVARVDLKRGFAFVFMENEQHGAQAIRALDGTVLDPSKRRPLKVEWARGDGAIKRREDERRRRSTEPSETLFVVNFDPITTTRQILEKNFSPYGPITRLDLQQRFAFIQFENVQHATAALQALNGAQLGDRYLIVEYTIRPAPPPSRSRRHDRPYYSYDPPPRSARYSHNSYRAPPRSPSPRRSAFYPRPPRIDRPWSQPYHRDSSYSPRRGHRDRTGQWTGANDYRRDLDRQRHRSPSPTRARRRSRSRSRDKLRKRSRSRSRDRPSNPSSAQNVPPFPRGRSRSRSHSPRKRTHSLSPGTRSSRRPSREEGDTKMRDHNRSRSPKRNRSYSRSRSPVRKRARSRSRGRSRSKSPVRARSISSGRAGRRSRSRTPTRTHNRSKSPVRGRSRSRSASPMQARSRSRSASPMQARSRSRSGSPIRPRGRSLSPVRECSGNRSRSRSRSRVRSRSGSRSKDRSYSPVTRRVDQDGNRKQSPEASYSRYHDTPERRFDRHEVRRNASQERLESPRKRTPSPYAYETPIGV